MGTDRKAFHLRWNNHMENMRSLFETSYCDQALVDVTVSCPDGKLKAHKLVLSACSPYFESVFKENPCKHPVLIMKGISYKEMSSLLEYMYKGEVDVLETELQSLINTASDLQIRGLGYGYQTETTVAASKAPTPLRNSSGNLDAQRSHTRGIKTADMAPVATPKSQTEVIAKVPESAATALNQDYDMQDAMNSSIDYDSMSGKNVRFRGRKRAAAKSIFDASRMKRECDTYVGTHQLLVSAVPTAPTSSPAHQSGLNSPSVAHPAIPSVVPTSLLSSSQLMAQNSTSSSSSPISLTVPTIGASMLSGLMTATRTGNSTERISPAPTNKFIGTANGVAYSNVGATNLSMNKRAQKRQTDDEPKDLTSASNGCGNSEDDEIKEQDDDDIDDDDDEHDLTIDTSKMEVSIKEEMEEDDDTIGYLCESSFTEGETTNGLSEKIEPKGETEENLYDKEGTVCPFCFRDCKTTDALKRHIRIHTSQKPHQCEYCQLAFARSSHLERHRRTHTGERPFVCPIASCSKRFARQDKVKQHVIRHHTGLPRPVGQSPQKAYKPRAPAASVVLSPGGKRPRGRPRKHPSAEDFMGHLFHGHTLLEEGSQQASGSAGRIESMSDPLTCPPAKDFATPPMKGSPTDFLQRDADHATRESSLDLAATESRSALELGGTSQDHLKTIKHTDGLIGHFYRSHPLLDDSSQQTSNSPADFIHREVDRDRCANSAAAENLSTLELSVSTQEHLETVKQISQCSVEPVSKHDKVADTASVGT